MASKREAGAEMRTPDEQADIRLDVFRWLDEQLGRGAYELSRAELESYTYGGQRIPLIDRTRGIRNPRDFDATLSILTSSQPNQYADEIEPGGLIRYSYQSKDGGDNVKLRRALELGVPLVYFQGVRPGFYQPYYPVHVVAEDTDARVVKLLMDDAFELFGDPFTMTGIEKRYAERTVKQRLHQPLFRARVLYAYDSACAICDLAIPQLLEAAHITPDADDEGSAAVSNGIALCALHHTAYDANIIGIDADRVVRVPSFIRGLTGPKMLEIGLIGLDGQPLHRPKRRSELASQAALASRFMLFKAAEPFGTLRSRKSHEA